VDAVFLLSGGLDSAVALALAQPSARSIALTFDYGQRAARREIESARAMAARAGIEHRAIELPFLGEITRTALVARAAELPRPDAAALDSAAAKETAKAVWVPNRNGVFIAIAAAFAEAAGLKHVVVGFNREEGATFPDNTREFVACSNAALAFSTLAKVKVHNPVGKLDKLEIVQRGREAGAPIPLVWSCYEGGDEHCGTCESCRRLFRALEAAEARAWFEGERSRARAEAGRAR
jgi:7-cyano-7-deazaguanine synthase